MVRQYIPQEIGNFRMPRFQVLGQAARRFRDDFEAARHCIESQSVVAKGIVGDTLGEATGEKNVVPDIV
jgi:hypothetical protein